MKKYTAEEIYGICRDITNQLEVTKRGALKENGDDCECEVTLELTFKQPDGTRVPVKISSADDVLELVEKYGYCEAEELAKAREMFKQDAAKSPVQKACEELDKAFAELIHWQLMLDEAHSDYEEARSDYEKAQSTYEDACDTYEEKRREILKKLFGDDYPQKYDDLVKKPQDLRRLMKVAVKGD